MSSLRRVFALLATVLIAQPASAQDAPRRPNFLVIVADDLGFSDIGAFGGEIETPNLDALAARGLKLTGLHVAPTCSPTRSMLLTGLDNHEAGLGSMAEALAPNQQGRPGHEGFLRPDTATLAELLGAAGYRTLFSGKWHLGLTPAQDPFRRGFDRSFAMLQGSHNHFGHDLSADPGKVGGYTYRENGETLTSLPAGFYSSDFFATKLIEQLRATASGSGGPKPFFAYLAFTAPHWPLHAPAETIAKYKGRYDAGYEALRQRRLKRQVELGLLDPKAAVHEPDLSRPWDSLTAEQKARAARRMEVYAAMVDRLDWNVGRVVAALRESGQLDDTVILFLSDNGAEGAALEDRSSARVVARYDTADNRIGNIGSASSYESLGPGWAEAATAPAWRFKAFQTEGGTRTVGFLTGPGVTPGIGQAFTSVMDVTPTFLDLARVPRPGGSFAARAVKPIRGRSWTPWLTGGARRVYPPETPVGAELFGGRALRQGDWKLLDSGDGRWRLFNVAQDPGETRDLSAAEPQRLAALIAAWDAYAAEVGVVLPDGPQPILTRPGAR